MGQRAGLAWWLGRAPRLLLARRHVGLGSSGLGLGSRLGLAHRLGLGSRVGLDLALGCLRHRVVPDLELLQLVD